MQKLLQKLSPAIIVTILIAALSLSGCSTIRFPGVYRVDIPQGNFVTSDMLAKLAPGMTPDQVRYVMGVPTLVDPFTPDIWFYLMTYQPGKGKPVDQQIIVYYENGVYTRYEGEVIEDLQKKTQAEKDEALQKKASKQLKETDAEAGTKTDTSETSSEGALDEATPEETSSEEASAEETAPDEAMTEQTAPETASTDAAPNEDDAAPAPSEHAADETDTATNTSD